MNSSKKPVSSIRAINADPEIPAAFQENTEIYCKICKRRFTGEPCWIHAKTVSDRVVTPLAVASLPDVLYFEPTDNYPHNKAVHTSRFLPIYTVFGPLIAPVSALPDTHLPGVTPLDSSRFENDYFCNWMKYVRVADDPRDHNIAVCFRGDDLMFVTTRPVRPHEELKMGYSLYVKKTVDTAPVAGMEIDFDALCESPVHEPVDDQIHCAGVALDVGETHPDNIPEIPEADILSIESDADVSHSIPQDILPSTSSGGPSFGQSAYGEGSSEISVEVQERSELLRTPCPDLKRVTQLSVSAEANPYRRQYVTRGRPSNSTKRDTALTASRTSPRFTKLPGVVNTVPVNPQEQGKTTLPISQAIKVISVAAAPKPSAKRPVKGDKPAAKRARIATPKPLPVKKNRIVLKIVPAAASESDEEAVSEVTGRLSPSGGSQDSTPSDKPQKKKKYAWRKPDARGIEPVGRKSHRVFREDYYAFLHRYPCPHCALKFYSTKLLAVHEHQHKPESERAADDFSLKCIDCDHEAEDMMGLSKHMDTHGKEVGEINEDTLNALSPEHRAHPHCYLYACENQDCHRWFCTETLLKLHRREHYPALPVPCDSLQCSSCEYLAKDVDDLARHTTSHGERITTRLQCPVCLHVVERLSKHVQRKHPEFIHKVSRDFPLGCDRCNSRFVTHYTLEKHREFCKRKLNQCYMCSKQCTSRAEVMEHIESHVINGKYPCPSCDLLAVAYENVTRHIKRSHNAAGVRVCEICQLVVKSSRRLTVHMKTHDPSMDFLCDQCGKRYNTAVSLRQHRHYVHGEKLKAKINRKNQEKKEMGIPLKKLAKNELALEEYPYRCDKCQVGLLKRGLLRRHVQDKHKDAVSDSE
ncbi:zinc finger and BTB domain-containing protein 17-like [Paramacrobiotus metropolitanus]|uniref:zinc finger and BTB domain-containing protein 17-like n=1 Tax=Paramacrobiotus metropolitanus TaxID=2943436 RepID=UPI00244654CA|nr:zinc finger and BTB domain-containing protein 17-like [Paramacrobiotus metropolitanus]